MGAGGGGPGLAAPERRREVAVGWAGRFGRGSRQEAVGMVRGARLG